MSANESRALGGQIAVRASIASYFRRDSRKDKCIMANNSLDCISLLASKLKYKANQMVFDIIENINRNEFMVKCRTGLSTPDSPELR
jgi:hypothetical protein